MSQLNYDAISSMTDDPFWMFKKMSADLSSNKIVKFMLLFVVAFHLWLFSLQVYYIVNSSERKEIIYKYSPTMCATLYSLFCIFILINYESEIKQCLTDLSSISWSLQNSDRASAMNEVKPLVIVVVGCIMACLISVSFYLPFYNHQEDVFLTNDIFGKYFPNYCDVLSVIFWITLPFLVYFMIVNPTTLFYVTLSMRIQMFIVNQHFLRISDDFKNDDEVVLYHSVDYQREIYKRLCFSIEQHICLISFIKNELRSFWTIIQVHVFLFLALNIGIIFFLINNFSSDNSWHTNLRAIFITLTGFMSIFVTTSLFQNLADMTGRIFETACELPWYMWNIENRRVLLLLMMNCMDPIHLNVPGAGAIGYAILLQFIKISYSLTTLLSSVRD